MLRKLELTGPMHEVLISHCRARAIDFLSSGFDIASLDLLTQLGLQQFKVPSGEITNLPYLRHLGRLGKRVILSTGMATLGEIETAIDVLEAAGTQRDRITILHCNTDTIQMAIIKSPVRWAMIATHSASRLDTQTYAGLVPLPQLLWGQR